MTDEKPITLTTDDAKRIKEACEAREYEGAIKAVDDGHSDPPKCCLVAMETPEPEPFDDFMPGGMAAFFALAQEVMPQVPALIEDHRRMRERAEKAEAERDELRAENDQLRATLKTVLEKALAAMLKIDLAMEGEDAGRKEQG